MNDLTKAALIVVGYLGVAPVLGLAIRNHRSAQRWLFALLVFMTSWHINKLTVMLGSIEWYRGHTKGFEFSLLTWTALVLLIATFTSSKGISRRWFAPGTFLYLLYVAMSAVSLFAAPNQLYVVMAAWRYLSLLPVFLAAYHFLREEEDLHVFLKALSATLCFQALLVLKMKYFDQIYQVNGWFEHQNSLAMWAYLCGLPLLAAAMGPVRLRQAYWYGAGFAASAVIVQSALSRASLAAFAIGVPAVAVLCLVERPTFRRLTAVFLVGVFASIGLLFTWQTLADRFREERNVSSGELRTVLNQASKSMLRDSPIGQGWNNYALVINRPYPYAEAIENWQRGRGRRVNEEEANPQSESLYWLLLAESGYPGFLACILLLAATTFWCGRGAWAFRHTVWGAVLIGLVVALCITYLHSTIERVLTQTKNIATWLILLGLIARVERWRRETQSQRASGRHV